MVMERTEQPLPPRIACIDHLRIDARIFTHICIGKVLDAILQSQSPSAAFKELKSRTERKGQISSRGVKHGHVACRCSKPSGELKGRLQTVLAQQVEFDADRAHPAHIGPTARIERGLVPQVSLSVLRELIEQLPGGMNFKNRNRASIVLCDALMSRARQI